MPTARERKKQKLKYSRGTHPVSIYTIKAAKTRRKSKTLPSAMPKGLSADARFMELRPVGYSPIEWIRLFTEDEELWPVLVEEAVFALTEEGEILIPKTEETDNESV